MEGIQQQSNNAPVARRSCDCPRGSKNRVSATQVPIQEGDGRGKFNIEAALTQPDQEAQLAGVKSINPWVPKLIQKPIKVTTTKTVINKEIKLTSFVFDPVYHQELALSAMIEKVKPVLDTSYEPYVSDSNQEDIEDPEYFQNKDGQPVIKKVVVFYTKVFMSCIPVANKNPGSSCRNWLLGTTSRRTRQKIFITKDLRF
ncbi:hypothetical protein DSO57_1022312 [Entomophthora muscae]|uniref:Uncharacterized protein n=1 Tax=Entomophthora muscae TaxID=34485 RepID=A0ACC2SG32_9FUNG|nr:hypothetical protein DSO57_1022312 [Entomophthora muscae]